jgi:exopolysaccharide biosynthesis polyprenyl glycosylphosphotransferase
MSSPVTIKTKISGGRTGADSTLNAGVRTRTPDVPRQKLQSIAQDGRFWTGERPTAVRAGRTQTLPPMLAELLLPRIFAEPGSRQAASLVADLACVILNFIAIGQIRVLCNSVLYQSVPVSIRWFRSPSDFWIFLIYGAVVVLLGYSERLYDVETIRRPRTQEIILFKVGVWVAVLATVAAHFSGVRELSVATLATATALNYLTMLGWRKWWRRQAGENNRRNRKVLIVGAGTIGRRVAAWMKQDDLGEREIVGFLDDSGPVSGEVLGRTEDLARVARANFVDEIIVALPHAQEPARIAIAHARHDRLTIKTVLDLYGFEPTAALENCGGVPLVTLHEELVPELDFFLKRALDVTLSICGLILASPLMAVIALIIGLDSCGPVFYRAARAGKKRNRFLCCKFRTMVTEADKLKDRLRARNERKGACFKITGDPRITRVGGFLRRYSLDELPQLWNVLCGEMSLVGPRPHPLDDVEQYELEDLRRLEVKPGMTGLWQVKARRDPSFRRNIELDVEYIDHWNLWMDLRILCKTVSVVLQGSGV